MIKPDPTLRQLFLDIDRSKYRVWALTNAYKPVRPSLSSTDTLTDVPNSTPNASCAFCTWKTKSTA